MEDKKDSKSLEDMCLNKITSILEELPDKGENIDLNYISKECKKIEVCSSIA